VSEFDHFLRRDIEIGDQWVDRDHLEKHIEIIGGSGQGKTTLAEQLMLGVLTKKPAGILLIDPTGDSCDKYLGWVAEGRITRPAYSVSFPDLVPRFNPLTPSDDVAGQVSGLFEALHLIQSDTPAGQHRQMQRFVTATLRALIEAGLTLADAFNWLTDESFRQKHLGAIRHPETRLEWQRSPSQTELRSTLNWFAVFWEHDGLKKMYSGTGFDWSRVYEEQAIVLISLRGFLGSLRYSKAVGALFLTALFNHAAARKTHKLWYAVIDDATDYTPAHVAQYLTLGRHFNLFLVLIHHLEFPGSLQRYVQSGCRTKFYFGQIPREHHWRVPASTPTGRASMVDGPDYLPAFTALQVYDGRVVQQLQLERSPKPTKEPDVSPFVNHDWYKPRVDSPLPPEAPRHAVPPSSPPPGFGANPKSPRPRTPKGR
jgi:hypothetical protein